MILFMVVDKFIIKITLYKYCNMKKLMDVSKIIKLNYLHPLKIKVFIFKINSKFAIYLPQFSENQIKYSQFKIFYVFRLLI